MSIKKGFDRRQSRLGILLFNVTNQVNMGVHELSLDEMYSVDSFNE